MSDFPKLSPVAAHIAVAAVLASCACRVMAQAPVLPNATQPLAPAVSTPSLPDVSPHLEIPAKVDATPDTDGLKIPVSHLKLVGAYDHPDRGLTVAALQQILDEAVARQPSGGYTVAEWQEQAAARVAKAYRDKGFPLAIAFLPAQTIENHEAVVQVLEGRLAHVRAEGNKHYRESTLEAPFESQIGGAVQKDALESRLQRVTDYPGIAVYGLLVPGAFPGDTDLVLKVTHEKPVDFSIGVDNYGAPSAGQNRGHAGLVWNSPFGIGDRLDLSVLKGSAAGTSGESGASTLYYSAGYLVPLAAGRADLNAGYSRNSYTPAGFGGATGLARVTDAGIDIQLVRTRLTRFVLFGKGYAKQADFNYSQRSTASEERLHDGQLGLSFEHLDEGGSGRWSASVAALRGTNSEFDPNSYLNGQSLAFQATQHVVPTNAIRLGTVHSYTIATAEFERIQRITRYNFLRLHAAGQQTSDVVPTLEQLSLTGPTAVRAYEVGHYPADQGVLGTAELYVGAPGVAGKPGPGGKPWGDVFQLVAFYDGAEGKLHQTYVTPAAQKTFKGAGASLVFNWPQLFQLRFDAARPISAYPDALGSGSSSYKATRYYGSLNFTF